MPNKITFRSDWFKKKEDFRERPKKKDKNRL